MPYDLVGYLIEIDTGRIDSDYMNSRFEKYLKLIEERNHELEKEREKEKKEPREEKKSSYQAIKPEIRINPEYFKKAGIPLEDEEPEEDAAEGKKEIPEVTVDLDAEYFKWKAKEKDNKKK